MEQQRKNYFSYSENLKYLKSRLTSEDVIYHSFEIDQNSGTVIYIDSICDKNALGELVLKPLKSSSLNLSSPEKKDLPSPNTKISDDLTEVIGNVLNGYAALLAENKKEILLIDIADFSTRAVTEPPTSAVVKGPREGFTEDLKTNLSLLRRKLKTDKLNVKYLECGKYSRTKIAVCYINGVCDETVVKSVIKRINALKIDGISDSSYIASQIVEHKKSLFKQVGNTEKPDILSAKMLEGRVGIIVDGSPIALTVPFLFIEDFQSSEDYFKPVYRSNMQRITRVISIVIAIYLPAMFVAAQLFHLQLIPLNFLLTIVSSIKGIPLSPSLEMFFTLLIFEILNEASVRMPKYLGMALSVVGALVLGETAVRAGIVSSPTILIMALSGICLYTVPELVDTMSFLRLALLIVAGSSGGYGVILLSCFILIYLCSLENFDVPFLAPFGPFVKQDIKDSIYIEFFHNLKTRPLSLHTRNLTRMKINEIEDDDGNKKQH